MRVGIYDPYLDDVGGGEKYMMTLAECLSKEHDVTVFWDDKNDLENVKERFSLNLDTVSLTKNIFAHGVSFITKLQETKKYDAIIFLSDGSIPVVFSKKLFIHVQQPFRSIKRSSLKDKAKFARITQIFFNSQFTADFTKPYLGKVNTTVIYPPVSLQVKEVKKENSILHVGRFRVQDALTGVTDFKKQSVMITAFKNIIDKTMIKDWKFIIAASVQKNDEEKFEMLKKSAQGYPIDFLVNRTNSELWDIYNKAKIYWHASGFGENIKTHPELAEHFGISTVEAMGAGAVPVVINAGGQVEIVTNGENGFLWNSLKELEERTKELTENELLWEKLSKNAKERAKDFGGETFCKKVHVLLTQK